MDNLNPESFETLPLDKITFPLAFTTAPSAKARKECFAGSPPITLVI